MKFREIIGKTKIDFIGMRSKSFVLSGILILLGFIAIGMLFAGKANLSVDFTGGTNLRLRFQETVSIGDLRNTLSAKGLHDVQIQEVTGTKDFLVKTKIVDTDKEKVADKVQNIISTNMPGKKYEVLESNMVGPMVGEKLRRDAIIAIIFSFIGIILYIWIRFNFVFGITATIATFHDVISMLGIFVLLGREMNILFITALLTIAGYSLTDTVVIFDRIRENMAKMKNKEEFGPTINRSINEVLSRSIVTSISTFLVVVVLLFAGGAVLFDFALALLLGVFIGSYSSIFVAAPIIFLLRKKIRQ
ncbi:MAG TPA: protein translocase subunit SecF [Syntrophorhabdaceae bacterium]|nr:protein translocase subunit SecF [Syntrophorhabdaceae bacterium]